MSLVLNICGFKRKNSFSDTLSCQGVSSNPPAWLLFQLVITNIFKLLFSQLMKEQAVQRSIIWGRYLTLWQTWFDCLLSFCKVHDAKSQSVQVAWRIQWWWQQLYKSCLYINCAKEFITSIVYQINFSTAQLD